ncbi:MAG: transcriptional regulator [Actinobacteria bacterium]|nr:transcriptional regulator [Actinomycetota bacterium]
MADDIRSGDASNGQAGQTDYQLELGQRLRQIRSQQGLTLQEVEERSDGEWKAVVVGSYERGDRAVSVAKLARLAGFYGVPVSELLPEIPEGGSRGIDTGRVPEARVKLDLSSLERDETSNRYAPVLRYAKTIQVQRGDYNGRVLTLRTEDLRALAILYATSADDLMERFSDEGLLVGASA